MKKISKSELVNIASERLRLSPDYISGMTVTDVTQDIGFFRFVGEYFLDSHGLPTENTKKVFSVFSKISDELSKEYVII